MGRGTIRALVAASAVMALLIVAGGGLLVAMLARRTLAPAPVEGGVADVRLAEPPGTRIAGASGPPEAVVLRLEGGGPDRVVVVDSRSGRTLGRIGLAP